MKISVVTPSFNQGAYIAQAIESVLAQRYPDFEHIIVDNCSTDDTAAVLSRYPHLKVISEKDAGQSDALNKGFKAARGDIVGWLNADDLYLPGAFDGAMKMMQGQPDLDIVYGDYRFVDVEGKLIQVRKELAFDFFMLKYLHVLYIPTTTTFFRRKIFEAGDFLDISYHYAMDYEYFVRLAQKGYRFGHIDQVMADFRWHADAKSSRQTVAQLRERDAALLMHDKSLAAMKEPFRSVVGGMLTLLARVKRFILKLVRGNYC